jgi:hypothetical protein
MSVPLDWLRAEAARLGLALDDEDLIAIRDAVEKTRTSLMTARPDSSHWDDPAVGFLPLARDPASS